MNVLNVEHISKVFAEKVIFKDVSFGIQEEDKVGIVGINGTGKTTLLNIIANLEEPDTGEVVRQNGLKVAYLPQNPEIPENATVMSYAFGEAEEAWKVQSNLLQLGITELNMPVSALSGGQKRRLAMARFFAGDADLLLLDEPTNHLDEEMLNWLEEILRSFKGAILMVTHDRYFLDRVTNRILEVSHGKIYSYEANYSGFLEMKAAREEMEQASERKRRSILRVEEEWARRGCRARSTKQRARLERLEALKKQASPRQEQTVELDSMEVRMGKKTIELSHVSKRYGEKKILEDFSYTVLKNQRVGIIGPNGCGKSTLLKIIAGQEEVDAGQVQVGETIRIGYFAQEEEEMNEDWRVIDYVKDIAEYITTKEGRISASQMLERFLFPPQMQYAPIGKLSGGERRRLSLLGILARQTNVLLLDEVGNSLDIPTMTLLEDFLNSYQGIVITVSHDRYFLDNVVDRIFAFEGPGLLRQYEGGYTDCLEARNKKQQQEQKAIASGEIREKRQQSGQWKQRHETKLKFTYKEQKEYETIEEDVMALEKKIELLEQRMMENATNSVKLSELLLEKEQAEQKLSEKMERWVYLSDLAEKIQSQEENRT